ncbi:MAG TPA: EAL domain-containing protein [Allosphingosinicella sp.]|nr:EAL domain-containing protein [Allosphingosinicella sp.]
MLRVYSCIAHEHDWRLIVVAGIICLVAAFTAFSILEQARLAHRRRPAWLAAAGFVSGTGIWATHFVAMLAYEPRLPIGYDAPLTLLSIAVAMVVTAAGWWTALRAPRWAPAAAGAVIGAGIGSMHYLGMAAVTLPGRFVYDEALATASILIGIVLAALALADQRRRPEALPWRPALLFTAAICGLHFTAMGAATIIPDPRLAVPEAAIGSQTLAVAVVVMALVILAISLAVVLFDRKLDRQAADEARRLRTFADAAIEGLVVVDGDRIVDANRSFLALAGIAEAEHRPASLAQLLPGLDAGRLPTAGDKAPTEARLIGADGRECPVEVLARPLDWRGVQLRVLAIRDVSERKEAAARIAHLALHDALTGLPNRAVFADRLAATLVEAEGEPVAAICVDLDGFKAVNDMFGHPVGDALLVEAGQRLRAAAGPDCLVARLGGDEFAIVQTGDRQPHRAGQLSERLVALLGEPFVLGEQAVRISCSVGVALYPADAESPADLVKNADLALYRAKADGRGTTRFYEPAMDEALRQRRQLDADLRQAIDKGQMAVHYQPLADLESGRIVAFEALLRWTHPVHGPVSPYTFVPLAEESGFIVALGEWVLRQACAEAAGWQSSLRLSVNLSPVQFVYGDLAATVQRIVADTGLDPARLDLEVTEGLLIKDAERALAILRRLKALGVQISMDDFGTGYSSLSYFRMFPFDKVKIDQSFVREMMDNPQARAIVRSVIGLGRGLGMPVVAEGVETGEQLDCLRAEGCDQVQGYLISRPGPIEQFDRVVIDRGDDERARRRARG